MKKCILFIISFLSFFNLYSAEKSDSCFACIFMDIEFPGNIPIYDLPNGKIIKKLQHNINKENFIMFTIKQKSDSMFYVSAYYSMNENSIIATGWIKKTDKLGIYSRAYNQPMILYQMPTKKSRSLYIFKEYNPEMLIVIDCKGGWLKVKIKGNNSYVGWIPPEMQCCNVYSTCS